MIDLKEFVIDSNATIKESIMKIDKNKKRFLICVDSDFLVKGVLTDGDLRRSFLNKFTIKDKILDVFKKDFNYLNIDDSFDVVCEKFKFENLTFYQ